MLPKVNKADIAGKMESIQEYLRSCHAVIRAPLAYVIRKTITVQVYGDYVKYVTLDDKMIARMLHLPPNIDCTINKEHSQLETIQQSTREITELSMTSWIRSTRILTDNHMSNSISPRGMAEGHIMPSTPGGYA